MPDKTSVINNEALAGAGGLIEHSEPQQVVVYDTGIPGLVKAVGTTANHGLQVRDLDHRDLLPEPARASGGRQVSELLSFLDELDRRPLTKGDSTLWGDYKSGTLVAVYNDHAVEHAGWRDDELTLKLVDDPDWVKWHAISGKAFRQYEFGDVVEELLHTVVSPDQAELLEIIDSIRASQSGKFESRIDRSTSDQALTYTQETSATAGSATRTLEVPKTITLRLRPWEGHVGTAREGDENLPPHLVGTYEVEAWFRLAVQNGDLLLSIKLKPTTQLKRTAWAEMVTKVVDVTGIPVLAYSGTR